jgi:UDPglucose 6-dehydrogenase
VAAGRLHFTTSYEEGASAAEFIFIAVPTPTGEEGGAADLKYVRSAAQSIAAVISQRCVIINKSTVPIGSGDLVQGIIEKFNPRVSFAVVSNPEFLREGSAISDFMFPDRVVLGSNDQRAAEQVASLYLTLKAPIIITDLRTAEMIKYASNAFLATKISFINEIAVICERLGADVKQVSIGMGYDKRIGRAFLDAGLGYGGSCFPKDVKALAHMAAVNGCHPQLLKAVMDINQDQRKLVVGKLTELLGDLNGKTICLLGLAFKPNTDDMRDAPSRDLVKMIEARGGRVKAFDPVATAVAKTVPGMQKVEYCADAYKAAAGADAVIVVTEWNEFKNLNMATIKESMRTPILIDGRNIYDPEEIAEIGFTYRGIGRANGAAPEVVLDAQRV